jgi:hypothetical protein
MHAGVVAATSWQQLHDWPTYSFGVRIDARM